MHFFSNLLHRYGLSAAGLLLVLTFTALAGSETTSSSVSARRFTLKQALETAFQRNPDILRARQEIRRTKGVQIEVTSQALPHITADSAFDWTEGSLNSGEVASRRERRYHQLRLAQPLRRSWPGQERRRPIPPPSRHSNQPITLTFFGSVDRSCSTTVP